MCLDVDQEVLDQGDGLELVVRLGEAVDLLELVSHQTDQGGKYRHDGHVLVVIGE